MVRLVLGRWAAGPRPSLEEVGGHEADGMLQKQPFVDDKSFRRPAVFFACVRVGEVYLQGEKTDRLPAEQAGLDSDSTRFAATGSDSDHERRRRHHLTHQRGVA